MTSDEFHSTKNQGGNVILYQDDATAITAKQLTGFFAGWPSAPTPQCHLRILQQSSHCIMAVDDATGGIVGFITALTDGVLSAYIPLLEVAPPYQHQGIGSQLVCRMLERLGHLYAIDLICDPALADFYSQFDFTPFHGMIIRHYQQQSGCIAQEGVTA